MTPSPSSSKNKLDVRKRGSRILNRLASRKDSRGNNNSQDDVSTKSPTSNSNNGSAEPADSTYSISAGEGTAVADGLSVSSATDRPIEGLTTSIPPSVGSSSASIVAAPSPSARGATPAPASASASTPTTVEHTSAKAQTSQSPELPSPPTVSSSAYHSAMSTASDLRIDPVSPSADLSRKTAATYFDKPDIPLAASPAPLVQSPSKFISLKEVPPLDHTSPMPYSPLASPSIRSSHNHSHSHQGSYSVHSSRRPSINSSDFRHSYNNHFSTTCLTNYGNPEIEGPAFSRSSSTAKFPRSSSHLETSSLLYRTGSQLWEASRESKGQSWLASRFNDGNYGNDTKNSNFNYAIENDYFGKYSSESEDETDNDGGILHIRHKLNKHADAREQEDEEYEIKVANSNKLIRLVDWVLGLQEDAPISLSSNWDYANRPQLSRLDKIRLRDSNQTGKVDVAWWLAVLTNLG